MTHPVIKAARAAGAELTSESAQKFFRDVAIAHTLMTVYYLFEFCCDTYEAGQKTRAWVSQRRAKGEPPAEVWTCAGLLSAAPEIEQQAIATLAPVVIKTNEQKLQGFITKNIQGIYDQTIQNNSTNLPVCVESINPSVDPEHLELVHGEDAASRAIGEVLTVKETKSRTRKAGTASSEMGKTIDKPSLKGRVPRAKRGVST
jgi:hypothetical protein